MNLVRTSIKTYLETQMTYGAAGTDNTTPAASDTALGGEVFRDAIDEFDDAVTDEITASLRILTTEANGNTLAEVGWFNASTAGTLLTRNTITSIAKTNDIQLFLDTSIQITVTEA